MNPEDVPPPPPPTYQPRRRTSTFNCTQCIKKYLSQDGLDAHVVKEHGGNSGDTLQPVDVTNLSSNQSNTYTPRRRTSTFNCTQCISKYLTQDGLDAHVKKEHTSADEENNENGKPPAPYVPPENTYTPRRRTSTYNCTQCIKKYC